MTSTARRVIRFGCSSLRRTRSTNDLFTATGLDDALRYCFYHHVAISVQLPASLLAVSSADRSLNIRGWCTGMSREQRRKASTVACCPAKSNCNAINESNTEYQSWWSRKLYIVPDNGAGSEQQICEPLAYSTQHNIWTRRLPSCGFAERLTQLLGPRRHARVSFGSARPLNFISRCHTPI